ncbi:MFS transporter [Paenibacillus wynnii]|uniref:MFS transporter n=1 Tax=Paenibacillus wynnii TaxID=268407 RepID=UPI002791A0F2|nr:MFS transporter [Paenibacillus wynnii]MDQ0193558.1 putative MFS family arabinose efflux permease [Paenibacillus wynnii]
MEQLAGRISERTEAYKYSLVTTILAWCGLVVVSSLYITIPMVSVFANAFNVTPSQASWVNSSFSLTYAIGFLFIGSLSEKYGRKQIMLYGLVALFLVSPILGFVHSLPWLIVLRAIQGAAAATFGPAVLTYIVEMYPIEKRVTTIGFVSTGFLMAGIIGQVFSSIISENFGWSYVFYILGGIYLLSAILLGGLVPRGDVQHTQVNIWTTFQQIGNVFSKKSLFFCYLVTVTLLLSFVGMYATLGNYLSQSHFDLNNSQILMVRAAGIIGMLVSPFAGWLAKRFGAKRVLQGGLLFATAGLAMVGISSNLPILICMSIVFVTGIAVSVPTLISLIGSLAGEARGIGVTLYTFILFIGATLGPIVAINLMKFGSYTITFEVLASILGIGMLASFLVKANANSK